MQSFCTKKQKDQTLQSRYPFIHTYDNIIRNKRLNSIWLQNYFIYISYYHLGNGNHETHEDLEMTNNAMNDHIDVWLHACPSSWSTVFQITFRVWRSWKIITLGVSGPGPSLFFLGVFMTQDPFIWNTGSALMTSDHKQRIKLPLGLAHVSFDVNVVGKNWIHVKNFQPSSRLNLNSLCVATQ